MNRCKLTATLAGAGLAAGLLLGAALAADAPKPAEGVLVVVDAAGKEQKLKGWEFVAGTRRLSWLAPAAPAKEGAGEPKEGEEPKGPARPKAPAGPEALEFREENSTDFREGILTLIPLDRIRSIDYDENDKVSVHVATGPGAGDEEVLTGTTKYRGVNKLTLAAEVDKGDLGVAEIKYLGGVPKGVRAIRFPDAKAGPAAAEVREATVTVAEKEKNVQKVSDLQPLYRLADGGERLLPTLFFRKTLKVDVAKVQKLHAVEDKDTPGSEWEVALKDGGEETLTLLAKPTLDGKPATLEGLLGRVPAGYKLFPVHTLAEVEFGDGKPEPKP
jgi:hypothetical protein